MQVQTWLKPLAVVGSLVLGLAAGQAAENVLTDAEKEEGYRLLFNGVDFSGWHRTEEGYGGWKVVDGAICRAERGAGMLYSNDQFQDFVLKIEYKLDKGTNSGIFLRVTDPHDPVQTGIEMQVLDDAGSPPSRHCNGAIYDIAAPTKNVTRPTGEWNQAVITCQGPLLTVKMNGEQILHIDLNQWTQAGRNPDGSPNKFRTAYREMVRAGFLGLQDHGGRVWYRNIKIKVLKPSPQGGD